MINPGSKVYFFYFTGSTLVEHVGFVYCIIPAGCSINNSWFGHIVSDSTSIRSMDVYIVNVKGVLFLTSMVVAVPENKKYLESEVVPFKKHHFFDIRDRMTICALARDMQDSVLILADSLYVPAWKKRFIFSVKNAKEYICRIETVVSEENGVLVVQ
jgi:hypothetical protein